MSAVIRWEDPPPKYTHRVKSKSKYQPVADALRERPKEWALIMQDQPSTLAYGLSSRISQGQPPFGPKGTFEARTVGTDPMTVYARYVGEVES